MKRRIMLSGSKPDENTLLLLHAEDITDSSKYAHTLKNKGATIVDDGKFGKCLNTNNGEILIENFSIGVYSGAIFTVDCWVYVTQNDTFVCRASPDVDYSFAIVIRKDCAYVCRNGRDYYVLVWKNYSEDWHHIAVTIYNTSVKLYIDGILQGSSSVSRTTASAPNLSIGNNIVAGSLIDEFRISNVVRWESDFIPLTKPY